MKIEFEQICEGIRCQTQEFLNDSRLLETHSERVTKSDILVASETLFTSSLSRCVDSCAVQLRDPLPGSGAAKTPGFSGLGNIDGSGAPTHRTALKGSAIASGLAGPRSPKFARPVDSLLERL